MPDGIYALAEPGKGITAFNMNQEFNLFGRKTFLIGRTFESFPMINDAPLEKVIIKKKEGSWWGNLITGIVVAVALAAVAIAVLVTGGAILAVACLAGAAVGAAAVTTSVAITDHKNGHARSWLDFAGQLFMGTVTGAMAGASIYGLWMVAPVVADAFGLQASMSTGVISPLTYKIIPSIVKSVGYGLMGTEGALAINEISGIGSGQNWMLDNMFGGDQSKYDSAIMIAACMSMGYMQVGMDNAGLKTEKVKEDTGGVETYKGGSSSVDNKDLLDNSGKFIDNTLEDNYQSYEKRKSSKGQTPKNRLEWKKASDYWTKESPIARGNNFNKTVREADIYDYHEVNLENGKRLDSYDLDAGEIISRKATDLDKINESTYRKYLSEFSEKYSVGTKIRSNVYPELDGLELEGQYILEIPASNANLSNIEHNKMIAAEYDVILRFMEE